MAILSLATTFFQYTKSFDGDNTFFRYAKLFDGNTTYFCYANSDPTTFLRYANLFDTTFFRYELFSLLIQNAFHVQSGHLGNSTHTKINILFQKMIILLISKLMVQVRCSNILFYYII